MTIQGIISLIFSFFYTIFESIANALFIPASWRSKDISSDKVLITGASSGIGRQLSYECAKKGCQLILWDINEIALAETAEQCTKLGATVHYYKIDLTKRDEIYRVADEVKKDVGKIDILVNNAGVVSGTTAYLDTPDSKIELTMNVNAMAHFWTLKSFLPAMLETNHGHIVSVASMAGKLGAAGLADYCSSKHAAVGLDAALRVELFKQKKTGVHTTCVCPTFINTGMFAGVEDSKFMSTIPIMTTEYVVSKIMEAIVTNQYMLMLPRTSYLLNFLDCIMPIKAGLLISEGTGFLESMDSFKGRDKSE